MPTFCLVRTHGNRYHFKTHALKSDVNKASNPLSLFLSVTSVEFVAKAISSVIRARASDIIL
jgi:hypothetical protein